MKSIQARGLRGIALALLVALMVALSWLAPLESVADRQVDAGLKRALVSFATARALNAVISLAQGTEVSIQPVGVGVNLSVGQVLDPVNDLVEQFSSLMLMASVAFGVQKVLLLIGAHWAISLLLTVTAAAWLLLLWRERPAPHWLSQLLVIMLLVRFAIPAVTLASDALFDQFLARDYVASQQVIEDTTAQIDRLTPTEPLAAESPGMLDRFRNWMDSKTAEWRKSFDGLKQAVERATEHIVQLIVIFLLQTLILPLGLLWLLVAFARGSLARSLRARVD